MYPSESPEVGLEDTGAVSRSNEPNICQVRHPHVWLNPILQTDPHIITYTKIFFY